MGTAVPSTLTNVTRLSPTRSLLQTVRLPAAACSEASEGRMHHGFGPFGVVTAQ